LVIYQIDPDTGHRTTAGDVTILALFGPYVGNRELR
jgi:hypothetical protein